MKNDFNKIKINFKIIFEANDTWTCHVSEDGELESVYQGRSTPNSFSQETVGKVNVQYRSSNDQIQTLQSAGCTQVSDSSPLFCFFYKNKIISRLNGLTFY